MAVLLPRLDVEWVLWGREDVVARRGRGAGRRLYVVLEHVFKLCLGGRCVSERASMLLVACRTARCAGLAGELVRRGRVAVAASPATGMETTAGLPAMPWEVEELKEALGRLPACHSLSPGLVEREYWALREIIGAAPLVVVFHEGWEVRLADGGLVVADRGLAEVRLVCLRPEIGRASCRERV